MEKQTVSVERLNEFSSLWKSVFGEEVEHEAAREHIARFLLLYRTLYSRPPKG
jgi:hypothetical protein